jgi:ABC-type phosphate/phosphonate transport system permease subunit
MLDRIKKALVDSFAGAIAIGWLLSQSIYHCALLLVSPITIWVQMRLEQEQNPSRSILYEQPQRFPYEQVGSQVLLILILLLLAFLLLRWLYLEPAPAPAPDEPEDIDVQSQASNRCK